MPPTPEVLECEHVQRGGYEDPPQYCEEDALPETDPPRCAEHADEGYEAWEHPDYFD